jgi:FKBP-type peptidyl-prolyl cis-trans isomerase
MKNYSVPRLKAILILFLGLAFLSSCNRGAKPASDAVDKDSSYAFGMILASQIGVGALSFDYDAFRDGFRDFNEQKETRLTMENAYEKISAIFMRLQAQNDEEMWQQGQKNLEEGEVFMAQNRALPGVTTLPSGLQYQVMTQGAGAKPGSGDAVRVHYEGTLISGDVFDSSYARGEPEEFPLGMVIAGWAEGIQLMNEGSVYRFVIPSDLGYGPGGNGPIPPNATLIFLVELIKVLSPGEL